MNKYIHLMNQSYNIQTLIDDVDPVKHWCMINFSRTRILSCSLSVLSSLHLRFISHERHRETELHVHHLQISNDVYSSDDYISNQSKFVVVCRTNKTSDGLIRSNDNNRMVAFYCNFSIIWHCK
jgi:hypothetical protein